MAEILSSRSISSEICSASPARRAWTMTWSLCEARPSAPGLTRKSVRRAVVRPLEALLVPLALVADGLDDDRHFCTHLGPPFFGASDRRGQSPRAAGDRRPRQLSQLETTVSRPFSLIHSVDLDGVGVAGGLIGVYRPEDRLTPPALRRAACESHLRGQVARHFHAHADLTNFGRRPCHGVIPSSGLRVPLMGHAAS